MDSPRKMCARIDLRKYSDAKDVELGDDIEIVVKGKVKSLRGPEEGYYGSISAKGKEGKEKYSHPGSMEIEITTMKVLTSSEYAGMEDD